MFFFFKYPKVKMLSHFSANTPHMYSVYTLIKICEITMTNAKDSTTQYSKRLGQFLYVKKNV